jgi:hypothetical protein
MLSQNTKLSLEQFTRNIVNTFHSLNVIILIYSYIQTGDFRMTLAIKYRKWVIKK